MLVLCVGMIRSGSTWSYNLSRDVLAANGTPPRAGGYSESFAAWVGELDPKQDAVIKCHFFDDETMAAIEARGLDVRTVFTYRDAGQAIASSIRAFGHDFEPQAGTIKRAVNAMEVVRRRWPTLLVPYRMLDTPGVAGLIATFLGVSCSDDVLAAIAAQNGSVEARKLVETVAWEAAEGVYRDEHYLYHKQSLLHRTHFADPASVRPRYDLTADRREQLDDLAESYRGAGLEVGPHFYSNLD